jgi:hypothetical protein
MRRGLGPPHNEAMDIGGLQVADLQCLAAKLLV